MPDLKSTPHQRKQTQEKLLAKARKLQKELREIEIPLSVKRIPLYASRSSLMLKDMDQIDELLANSPRLSFVKIAERINIATHRLYSYRKKRELYRSKVSVDPDLRRPNGLPC